LSTQTLLLTGATGTFGRAFTKRILADPELQRICLYSRGEHAQAQMRDDLPPDNRLRWFIGDVRDRDRLRRAMNGIDVVVHAAALKRIEVGYQNPVEMVKTNIGGAINVIEAAQDVGVRKVVALSSDKAFQPVSPYGTSKALAESLFLAANNTTGAHGPRFAVCRYGNIWASNGSVVPRWLKILEASDTVPVTSELATRFFMTIDQAVDLVLTTIRTMKGGELAIPDLPAYAVGDLALAMGAKMKIMGLPDWEKLHEGMSEEKRSDLALRMTVDELRERLADLGYRPRLGLAA
jgi:FlaA1/EpsC-like NDP-sugar epimerase